ncbi:unnamed protein product, partial [Hymenolepis diminuta]
FGKSQGCRISVGFTTLTRLIESRALELTTGSANMYPVALKSSAACVQRPPQPISNQDPCGPAWFCI